MGNMQEALRLFQWGKESTRGTAVPATSQLAVVKLDIEPTDLMERPALARGLITMYPGNETVVARGAKWSTGQTPLTYEQLPNWCSMAIKGGVSPTGVGPYVYTYAHSLTADPAPDTWTLERRITDGSGPIDYEWAYALAQKLSFMFAENKMVMMSAEGFARRQQSSTLTAAQTMPTVGIPATADAKVYIDSVWGDLGTTQVTTQILAAQLDILSGLEPYHSLDARSDKDFVGYKLDPKKVGFDLKLTCAIAASGQFAAEKTAAEAGTLRAVRIQIPGSSSRDIKFNLLGKHEVPGLYKIGELGGLDVVEMHIVSSTDGTNDYSVVCTNNVASGPL